MNFEGKHFTLEEAQTLLPVLEALLKRAIEARHAAEAIEEQLQSLSRKVFLSGGMLLNVEQVRKQREAHQSNMQQIKDSLEEIEAIGVQVKDLETGLLDFPCLIEGETVLLCWRLGENSIEFWHTLDGGFRGRQPVDERFSKRASSNNPERPN
jgi:hypothetical protein